MFIRFYIQLAVILTLLITGSAYSAKYAVEAKDLENAKSIRLSDKTFLKGEEGQLVAPLRGEKFTKGGVLYLRIKHSTKSYGIYAGVPSDNAFKELYAFDPGRIGLSVEEVIDRKLYGKKRPKAYQDEANIYYDRNYIYSSRVPELHVLIQKNWITLKAEKKKNGAVLIRTQPPGAEVSQNSIVLGVTPYQSAGLKPGAHTFTLSAEGLQRQLVTIPIIATEMVTKDVVMKEGLQVSYKLKFPVTEKQISQANTLDQLEALKMNLAKEKDSLTAYGKSVETRFEQDYPPAQKPGPGVDPETDAQYKQYMKRFNEQKNKEKASLLAPLGGTAKTIRVQDSVVSAKIHIVEQQIKTWTGIPVALKHTLLDSVTGKYEFQFKIQSDNKQVDVFWKGTLVLDTLPLDTFIQNMKDSSRGVRLKVEYQNKRVHIKNPQGKIIKRFYRYRELYILEEGKEKKLIGSFNLPKFVFDHPEVQAWLKGDAPKQEKKKKDAAAAQKEQEQKILDRKKQEEKELIRQYQGEIVEIPTGTFFYKNYNVTMSAFAMHKTEVTQLHFERIMHENRSKFKGADRPIQGVTWDQAKQFCEDIGGALPTEAQWEYAARSGSRLGEYWKEENSQAPLQEYAWYETNSSELGVGNPQYGVQPIAGKKPNAWGLYDMPGNVAEWTKDKHFLFGSIVQSKDPRGSIFGHFRIFKGGSWKDSYRKANGTENDWEDPRYWGDAIGFRCAFPAYQQHNVDSIRIFLAKRDSIRMKKKFTGFREELMLKSNKLQASGQLGEEVPKADSAGAKKATDSTATKAPAAPAWQPEAPKKPEAKAKPKPAPKTAPKPATKAVQDSSAKPAVKPKPAPQAPPGGQTGGQMGPKQESKPAVKPETKEAKPKPKAAEPSVQAPKVPQVPNSPQAAPPVPKASEVVPAAPAAPKN